MSNKIPILGINVTNTTMPQAVEKAMQLANRRHGLIVTPNPEIIMLAQQDKEFAKVLNDADMCLADGIGVVIASKLIRQPLPERCAGYDFAHELFKKPLSFYLFGSKPGVADKAAENLRKQFPGIRIVGTDNGYYKDDTEIKQRINAAKPDCLIVCTGPVKQEKWIYENKDKLDIGFGIGLGGTIDGIAGVVKRAPEAWQKLGLEWLYRAIKQPQRFFRLLVLPKFVLTVLFRGKR